MVAMDVARFGWTDVAVKRAVDMWNAGKAASEIASVLGTTRNSVIGKMHRTSKLQEVKRYDNPVPNKKRPAAVAPLPSPTPVIEELPAPLIEAPVTEAPPETAKTKPKAKSSIDDLPWHPRRLSNSNSR
jgi:hypothetical protein